VASRTKPSDDESNLISFLDLIPFHIHLIATFPAASFKTKISLNQQRGQTKDRHKHSHSLKHFSFVGDNKYSHNPVGAIILNIQHT